MQTAGDVNYMTSQVEAFTSGNDINVVLNSKIFPDHIIMILLSGHARHIFNKMILIVVSVCVYNPTSYVAASPGVIEIST